MRFEEISDEKPERQRRTQKCFLRCLSFIVILLMKYLIAGTIHTIIKRVNQSGERIENT